MQEAHCKVPVVIRNYIYFVLFIYLFIGQIHLSLNVNVGGAVCRFVNFVPD